MKKLLVMVIALAVVFGMSAVVMAESTDNVDVDLNVHEFMTVNYDDGEYEIDLLETKKDGDAHYEYSVNIPIEIKSNTQFKLSLQEDLSRKIADDVTSRYSDVNEDFVWAFDDHGHDGDWDTYRYIVSPGVEIWGKHEDGTPGTPGNFGELTHNPFRWEDGMGASNTFNSNTRKWEGFANLNIQWLEENKSVYNYDFTMLEAQTYTGTITATVEAAD